MTATFRIGTAGWSMPSRYADDLPRGGTHLQRYARVLNAVEINTSFYRPHRRKTYERWAASTPPDFRFAVKIPKTITHEKRFADCKEELQRFADEVAGLGEKLAVLLVQLPPSSALNQDAADTFFAALQQRIAARVAIEPRHASWFTLAVDHWLALRKIARVTADPARVEGAGEPGGDPKFVYFRWHGAPRIYYSDYDAAALATLHVRLEKHRAAGVETWCIFDNTASGAALGNALTVARRYAFGASCSTATATSPTSARG